MHLLVAKCEFIADYFFCVSGIDKLITLGPLELLRLSCAIHFGFFAPAYPTRANEPRKSVMIGSVAPSLLRAVRAGDR